MSAPMFLVTALPEHDSIVLDGPEGHHAATVQRLRRGEALLLGDGRGSTAAAVVRDVGRGSVTAVITRRQYAQPPDPRLVVVQAIAKADRGELAVQAMTEVGVDEIIPWTALRSVAQWRGERGDRSRQRWLDTAREAAKQSRRAWLPEVGQATSTAQVRARLGAAAGALVLHEEATTTLSRVPLPECGDLMLVVGPEGGIAAEELAAFQRAGATPVRLGGTVLRTSTAGLAGLCVLSVRLARW
jgi:16S rRNA (uracil1498-N3)-methyltransferase